MSNPLNAAVPASFQNASVTLIAADGVAAKVLVDVMPAAAATPTSPLYFGGGSVIDATAVSTDAVSKDLILWQGQVLTVVGAQTGAAPVTASAIGRGAGDFIVDGWKPGDLLMCFAAAGMARQATDGILGIVSAVTAGSLSVHGAPFTALALAAGVRICRVSYEFRAPIPASSGTNGVLPNVGLLNHGCDASVIRFERKLGLNELLAVSAAAAVSALPAYVNVGAQLARY